MTLKTATITVPPRLTKESPGLGTDLTFDVGLMGIAEGLSSHKLGLFQV
jgi:hypothetical protein